MEYIFLAGIHGVGKTTLLNQISKDISVKNESISNLIRKSGKDIDPKEKKTSDIDKNQYLWKRELNNLTVEEDDILILDGHFTLINGQGKIEELPFTTFENTVMTKIILKKEHPSVIQSRLQSRDNSKWLVDELEKFQNREENRATSYSNHKKTPLFIYDDKSLYKDLIDFILE